MKITTKTIAVCALIMASSSAFSQLTVEDTSNEITNGLYDLQESLTYNFPEVTDFKLIQEDGVVITEGNSAQVNLGVLAAGSYTMIFSQKDGRMVRDTFEVKKR